jgi:hypothetical protein
VTYQQQQRAAEAAQLARIRAEAAEIQPDPGQVERIASILGEERLDRIRHAAATEQRSCREAS